MPMHTGFRSMEHASHKLSSKERKAMPAREFAIPKSRGFPLNDKNHQRMAISGATRSERAGNITPGQESMIKAKARRLLKK